MKLSRYRRVRWLLSLAALLGALIVWKVLMRPAQLVLYNDLENPLAGAALRVAGITVPIPTLAPGESIAVASPSPAAGQVELLLPDFIGPLPAGWLDPRTTKSYILHLAPGPAVNVTAMPNFTERLRPWFR
jgi:hypothetical protein